MGFIPIYSAYSHLLPGIDGDLDVPVAAGVEAFDGLGQPRQGHRGGDDLFAGDPPGLDQPRRPVQRPRRHLRADDPRFAGLRRPLRTKPPS